jgi:glycosyltransferase involved in cell wall biosynthesis
MVRPIELDTVMTPLPKVSVIIPCFNRGQFIAETIESVLDQTYPEVDLAVVDDGCTDNSRDVIERFADRLRILEHPGRLNRGQSACINLALAATDGKYVGILDSDDLWFPEKLAEQVAYLETHADVDMVFGNGEAIDEHGRHLYTIYEADPPGDGSPISLLLNCYIHLPTNALLRRRLLDRTGGFDEKLRAAQDHDMLLRVAEAGRIAYLNRMWYRYRRHGGSISALHAETRWRGGFRILDKAVARYPYPAAVVRKRKAVLHFRIGQSKFQAGHPLGAAWYWGIAFLCDPLRALRYVAGVEHVR